MRKNFLSAILFVLACAPIVGCGANNTSTGAGYTSGGEYPRGSYAPAAREPAPTQDRSSDEKEQRGNTPPGKDRTGAGPAEGAILDPHGVVTKQPVLRERQ